MTIISITLLMMMMVTIRLIMVMIKVMMAIVMMIVKPIIVFDINIRDHPPSISSSSEHESPYLMVAMSLSLKFVSSKHYQHFLLHSRSMVQISLFNHERRMFLMCIGVHDLQ